LTREIALETSDNQNKKILNLNADNQRFYEMAIAALKRGDFDFALKTLESGGNNLNELIEMIKIYHVELLIQNEELRQSQLVAESALSQFVHLFRTLPLPTIIVTESGHIEDFNELAHIIFSLEHEKFSQQFFPKIVKSMEHARLKKGISQAKEHGHATIRGIAMQQQFKMLMADFHISAFSKLDEASTIYAIMVVDQTERINQLSALEASRKHLMAYFDTAPVGMCSTDLDNRWMEVNDALCELLGYSREELLKKTWLELTHNVDLENELILYGQMLNDHTDQYSIDKSFITKYGTLVYVNVAMRCVRKSDRSINYFVSIITDITSRKKSQEDIQYLAHHDALTLLPNRLLLADRFLQARAHALRQKNAMAILYLDLDHFKNINDSLGHQVGDQLLKEVARRLKLCTRDTDTICRLGGDEFLLLLGDVEDEKYIGEIAKKILDILSGPFNLGLNHLHITSSIGVCVYPADGETFDLLLQNADTALYQAKSKGRNNYQFFTNEMNHKAQHRLAIESEIRNSIANNHFFIEYQPQHDITSGQLTGFEALVRWQHPKMGLLMPQSFISIAEDSGFIIELGFYVLKEACIQAKKWLEVGLKVPVSVNVSHEQLVCADALDTIRQALIDAQLPFQYLELELTESVLAVDPNRVLDVIKELKNMGITIAIDDFGTGYSSLSYLKQFDMDKLKIDKSFIRDVITDPDDRIIIEAIINLAHSLRIKCIAEGVETEQQFEYLKQMGCDQMQGYFLAPAIPAAKVIEYIKNQNLT
jgi:diguanylate cyclase (GGDEF)-like protein/PAS domain S-box-containing protein